MNLKSFKKILILLAFFIIVGGIKANAATIEDVKFNSTYYSNAYVDLRNAFGTNSAALKAHFLANGAREGRNPSIFFDAKYYLNQYADLKNAFKNDYAAAYNHFVVYGIKEGRKASPAFDVKYYLNQNADLKNAFKTNYEAAYVHFLNNGMKEGRKTSSDFDVRHYIANSKDLVKAFEKNYQAAIEHYLMMGRNEKRNATGHIAGTPTVTKKPSYLEDGTQVTKCTVCNEVLKTETLAKLVDENAPEISISIDGVDTDDEGNLNLYVKKSAGTLSLTKSVSIKDNESGLKSSDIEVVRVDGTQELPLDGTTIPLSDDGKYVATITAEDNVGNKATKTLTVLVDGTAPVFDEELEDVVIKKGEEGATYTVPQITATDNIDGKITVTPNPATVDASKEGTTEVTYAAEDKVGNKASKKINVTVDGTAPVFTSTDDAVNEAIETDETTGNQTYTKYINLNDKTFDIEKNVTKTLVATDNVDGVIATINKESKAVDVKTEGTYTTTYTATDKAGNVGTLVVNVVVDNGYPVIDNKEELENETIYIKPNADFELPITATDAVDGTIEVIEDETEGARIISNYNAQGFTYNAKKNTYQYTAGTVVNNTVKLTFTAYDSVENTDTNESQVTITLYVDNTKPTITSTKKDPSEDTTDPVTVTYKFSEIIKLPTGWSYTNDSDPESTDGNYMNEISKVYTTKTVEPLTVEDRAGNELKTTVIVDNIFTEAPDVNGFEENPVSGNYVASKVYNKTLAPTFDRGTAILYTLNDDDDEVKSSSTYKSGTAITTDGKYKLVVKDYVGNETTCSFVVDADAPVTSALDDLYAGTANKEAKEVITTKTEWLIDDELKTKVKDYTECEYEVVKIADNKGTAVEKIDLATTPESSTYTITYKVTNKAGDSSNITRNLKFKYTKLSVVEGPKYTDVNNAVIDVKADSNPVKEVKVEVRFDGVVDKVTDNTANPATWNLYGTVIKATYTANVDGKITVADLGGNTTDVNIKIENIDTTAPELTVSYYDAAKNKVVTASEIASYAKTHGPIWVIVTSNETLDDAANTATGFDWVDATNATYTDLVEKANIPDSKNQTIDSEDNANYHKVLVKAVDKTIANASYNKETEFKAKDVATNEGKATIAKLSEIIDETALTITGNTAGVDADAKNISDITVPSQTTKPVTVTLTTTTTEIADSSEALTKGWTKKDNKNIQKTYSANTTAPETVSITDVLGNTKTESVTVSCIDTTAPVVQVSVNGATAIDLVNNAEFGAVPVKISWSDTAGVDTANTTLKKDGGVPANYTGTPITEAGSYVFEIADQLGNKATYQFKIDLSEITLFSALDENKKDVANNGVTNTAVTITFSKGNAVVKGGTYGTNEVTLDKESAVDENGVKYYTVTVSDESDKPYTVTVSDEAGHSKKATFTIDKTAPKAITLKKFDNADTEITKGNVANYVTVTTEETGNYTVHLAKVGAEDTNLITATDVSAVENTTKGPFDDGDYLVWIEDAAGNKSNVETFSIDHTVTAEVNYSNASKPTNQKVTVFVTSDEKITTTDTSWSSRPDGKTLYKEFNADTTGSVPIVDSLGNTAPISYTVTGIDKTAPTISNVEYKLVDEADAAYKTDVPAVTTKAVVVRITADEDLQVNDTLKAKGWTIGTDTKTMVKTYLTNEKETDIKVVDLAGNISTTGVEVDLSKVIYTSAPIISGIDEIGATWNSDKKAEVAVNAPIDLGKVKAKDAFGDDLTLTTSIIYTDTNNNNSTMTVVNTANAGTYKITWTATDGAGQTTTETRTLVVKSAE